MAWHGINSLPFADTKKCINVNCDYYFGVWLVGWLFYNLLINSPNNVAIKTV